MIRRYLIESCNEPHGEGNGWVLCPDAEATGYLIWNMWADDAEECLAAFKTRVEAQEYLSKIWEEEL